MDKLRFGFVLEYFVGSLVTFATESQWLAEHPRIFVWDYLFSSPGDKDGVLLVVIKECAGCTIPFGTSSCWVGLVMTLLLMKQL